MFPFSMALGALLDRYKIDLYGMARASGIEYVQLNRWRLGQDFSVTPRQMVQLARVFCPKGPNFVEAHATLLHGYLSDHCVGPGAKMIHLEMVPFHDWMITTSFGAVYVPPGLRRDLQDIHNVVWENREVRKRIRLVAKFCREEALKKQQAKI
jgi:hypothetical protein